MLDGRQRNDWMEELTSCWKKVVPKKKIKFTPVHCCIIWGRVSGCERQEEEEVKTDLEGSSENGTAEVAVGLPEGALEAVGPG